MKKDTKLPSITLTSGYPLSVNTNGAICDATDDGKAGTQQISAAELDRIVAHAQYLRSQPKPPKAIKEVAVGHEITFVTENGGHESNADRPGDVYVGCERVPYAIMMRAHAASIAMRARKNRQ